MIEGSVPVVTDAIGIDPDELHNWSVQILQSAGASREAAEATTRCLVGANRRGIDSHGIVFLRFYLPRLRSGAARGDAHPVVVIDLPALALIDGQCALGAYVADFAMSLCCDKAYQAGAAVVAVKNSGHFGAASHHSELAASRGCIGIALSNSDPGMAPLGALGPVLGTNPLAIASPASPGQVAPSLDVATSVVAQGRIILAQRAGTEIPADWAIGPDGKPTRNPSEALDGAVLPMAGYKGFGLAFMIDVLAGCLPGARLSPEIPSDPASPEPERTGHCFIAIRADGLRDRAEYERSLERLAGFVHGARRADWADPFMIPGEREAKAARERLGRIPLPEPTVHLLRSLGAEFNVPFLL
jgi:LDH2 family malate/lactate/ureidoglycolate dehydrogenase